MFRHLVSWACIIVLLAGIIAMPVTEFGSHVASATLTSRLPIRIDGNGDFTAANGVTGGAGTQGDPWLIEGWDISGHDYGYCIYIGNTTGHFVVRDCRLHDARGNFAMYYSTESGVILHNAVNGTVTGNDIYSNDFDGVYLYNSSHIQISDNLLTGNRWGMILMSGSDNNTLQGNTVNASTDYGIGLLDSSWNLVDGNNASQNANMGIFLGDSVNNTLTRNTVAGNTDGIYLDFSDWNTVSENNVTANTGHGIYLWESAGNRIFHNNMLDNPTQAHDNAGANSWDGGFPSGGNHWDDYAGMDANLDGLGDTAYSGIAGGAAASDRYPFMQPWFPDAEPPVADAGPDILVDQGTVVRFNGSASTDNVGVAVYTWAFDGGSGETVLNGASAIHNFTTPGIYTVTLEARDSAGNRGTDTMTVTVNDTEPPVADAGPDLFAVVGEVVAFNGTASTDNVAIVNYTWELEQNGTAVTLYGPEPEHIFWAPGNITVELTVLDGSGNAGTDNLNITVTQPEAADDAPFTDEPDPEEEQDTGTAPVDGMPAWQIAAILLCAVAAIAIALLLLGRGKKPKNVN